MALHLTWLVVFVALIWYGVYNYGITVTLCIMRWYSPQENINKTWAIIQTSGGKDEPNIFFMRKSIVNLSRHWLFCLGTLSTIMSLLLCIWSLSETKQEDSCFRLDLGAARGGRNTLFFSRTLTHKTTDDVTGYFVFTRHGRLFRKGRKSNRISGISTLIKSGLSRNNGCCKL